MLGIDGLYVYEFALTVVYLRPRPMKLIKIYQNHGNLSLGV